MALASFSKPVTFGYGRWPKTLLYFSAAVFFAGVLVFSCFYLFSGYTRLVQWYASLNDCFYNRDTWALHFFTPATKNAGNLFTGIGIAISSTGLLYTVYRCRMFYRQPHQRKVVTLDAPGWYVLMALLGACAATISWKLTAPSYDEIFSAVNCAELPAFQAISYYMLPNNHLYFNLANNLLLGWAHDTVATGRLLSLMAYVVVVVCAFHWFRQKAGSAATAFAMLLPVALQFMTWGMAGQARGYEMQLMCAWVSFVCIITYADTDDKRLLVINTIFSILGFATIFTYLHIFITQLLFFTLLMLFQKRMRPVFFKYQLITVSIAFLLYLPALCFSGLPAITANKWVKPYYDNWITYFPDFVNSQKYYINCCFSYLFGEDRAPNFVLFYLPLALFLLPGKKTKYLGLFYTLLWLVFCGLTLAMRHPPFSRNLIMHFSLSMAIVVYTFYLLVKKACSFVPGIVARQALMSIFFFAPVVAYSIFLAFGDKRDVTYNLYYNDANGLYKAHCGERSWIPAPASIGFSQESFYIYYIFRQQHPNAHRCTSGNEDFYIKRIEEKLPEGWEAKYVKWKDGCDDYEYYKKR